jgi:hypothetical protein
VLKKKNANHDMKKGYEIWLSLVIHSIKSLYFILFDSFKSLSLLARALLALILAFLILLGDCLEILPTMYR